jgi:HEAT repeat protein
MPQDPKQMLRTLAQQALAGPSGAAQTSAAAPDAVRAPPTVQPEPPGEAVTALIDLYFACDDADERDIVFERLQDAPPPQTQRFFLAMMQHDEDDFMRAAAANLLHARGEAQALPTLLQLLQDAADPALFDVLLQALLPVAGAALFGVLQAIWQEDGRDASVRRAAMLGMDAVDAAKTADALVQFIDAQQDPKRMPEDQVELAMILLAGEAKPEALAALERLAARIDALPAHDEDAEADRYALRAFIDEGTALVRSSLAPT